MYNLQRGRCVLCDHRFESVGDACCDHSHVTGKFNGVLLCACGNLARWRIAHVKGWTRRLRAYNAAHGDR